MGPYGHSIRAKADLSPRFSFLNAARHHHHHHHTQYNQRREEGLSGVICATLPWKPCHGGYTGGHIRLYAADRHGQRQVAANRAQENPICVAARTAVDIVCVFEIYAYVSMLCVNGMWSVCVCV